MIRLKLSFRRHGGIIPLKFLADKERYSSDFKLQRDEGVFQDNLLIETKKPCVEGGGTGNNPWIVLF